MSKPFNLEPGENFAARYVIQQLLGEGDRKRTYLARDTKVDRLVAVSLVKPESVLSDPEGTAREAKVLGRIGSHDNIVSLYDYEISADGSAEYIVFEYLGGGTLAEHLSEAGPLSLGDILRLGRQLSRGLAHLHERGLIHRDVSPENIWLDERQVAHLGDFDSAITTAGTDELRPITTGSFAAPEELDGQPLDQRCDLYSLGRVLFTAATGTRAPGDIQVLRSKRTDLPSSFGDLVACLLAESPAGRPADANSVLQLLDRVRHASTLDALVAAGESASTEFKSSLHHPYGPLPPDLQKMHPAQAQKEIRKALNKAVTKTLAAFLNAAGGTLLIGVDDSGNILGIESDFPHLQPGKQHTDGWLLSLTQVITNALGPEASSAIPVSVVRHGDVPVAVIHCPARTIETWHTEDRSERFYIRASNATRELTGSSLLKYIRERWNS
jgi:serine/threonine protein kinase